jgi:hypothetical protein
VFARRTITLLWKFVRSSMQIGCTYKLKISHNFSLLQSTVIATNSAEIFFIVFINYYHYYTFTTLHLQHFRGDLFAFRTCGFAKFIRKSRRKFSRDISIQNNLTSFIIMCKLTHFLFIKYLFKMCF